MSAETVTVALKHPHGFLLRLFEMVDFDEPQSGGGVKTIRISRPRVNSPVVKINGYAAKYDPALPPAAQGSQYALTHGVDKQFFDEWMKQNRDHDYVVKGLIFAHPTQNWIEGKTRENEKLKCGLEPLDRDNLPNPRLKTYSANAV